MKVSLALRKSDAPGIGKLFSIATRWRLQTSYPHAGVVLGDLMYDINGSGLQARPYNKEEWDLFETEAVLDPRTEYENLKDTMSYDYVALLLFVLPLHYRDASRMYCYEWAWYLLTGDSSKEKVTPENLLALVLNYEKRS